MSGCELAAMGEVMVPVSMTLQEAEVHREFRLEARAWLEPNVPTRRFHWLGRPANHCRRAVERAGLFDASADAGVPPRDELAVEVAS